MSLIITHPEKPTETDKIDDNDYMAEHNISGKLPYSNIDLSGTEILELIESQIVSDVPSVAFENLDGDSDLKYLLIIKDFKQSANNYLQLLPNNLSTNQKSIAYSLRYNGQGVIAVSYLRIGTMGDSTNNSAFIKVYIHAETGKIRFIEKICYVYGTTATMPTREDGVGQWNETSTNITSIVLTPSSGNITGSFYLYRVIQN